MKKIFTLICMAVFAINANAQLPENIYPIKTITWGDITWKNGNNKKDKNENEMLFLMGTGNGYENIYCEYFWSEDKGEYVSRPYYTYINYEEGKTGIPGYGLYYKFTPTVNGTLKINVWVNKGNRKTFVVKGSNGTPLTPYVDYTFDGYVNGQNQEGTSIPLYFTADDIKQRHNDYKAEQEAEGKTLSDYVIEKGNQAVWGWITFNAVAGETYYVYQQSSQLGFGGFEFNGSSYSSIKSDKSLADEFAAVVDGEGKATNVTDKGSVVQFEYAGVAVEAVGGAVPTEVTPDLEAAVEAVSVVKENPNAPIYNLAGQQVTKSYKGVVIQNGHKFVQK